MQSTLKWAGHIAVIIKQPQDLMEFRMNCAFFDIRPVFAAGKTNNQLVTSGDL